MWGIVAFVSWKCRLCCIMILTLCRLWNFFVLCFRSWSFKAGDCCDWARPYSGAVPSSLGRRRQNRSVRRLQLPGRQPPAEGWVSPARTALHSQPSSGPFTAPTSSRWVLGTLNIPYRSLISVLQSSAEMLWGALTAKEHPTLIALW